MASDGNAPRAIWSKIDTEQNARLVDSLVEARSFEFVPYELRRRTRSDVSIRGYQWARLYPDQMQVRMTGVRTDGFFGGQDPYDKVERVDNKWYITIQMSYITGNMALNYEIDRNTADAVLKVSTNRGFEVLTYLGYILPNN